MAVDQEPRREIRIPLRLPEEVRIPLPVKTYRAFKRELAVTGKLIAHGLGAFLIWLLDHWSAIVLGALIISVVAALLTYREPSNLELRAYKPLFDKRIDQ